MSYEGNIYDYIVESSTCISQIVNNHVEILKDAVDYFLNNDIEQVYFVGTGTSQHANIASRKIVEKLLKMPVYVIDGVEFCDTTIYNKKTLVISSSHGGQSTSSIKGLEKAKNEGLKTISSTATHNSEITKYSDKVIYCEIGEEDAGPKTKGYQCAIVTNILFALEVATKKGNITAKEKQDYIARILKTSNNIPNIAKATDEWYKKSAAELLKCRRLVIIGYDNNIATYMEATLKILEAVRYSVTGYELDHFMHGIYHSIWEDDYMFYIGSKGAGYTKMLKMKKYFDDNRKSHNFIFTSDKNQNNDKNFIFDFIDDEELSFLEYIIPFQVITTRLSFDLGINANIPSDPYFHEKMGSYMGFEPISNI
ncbi:MAG: hypothetical protein Ta2D_01150 [Rickettsiales bacterium]|nr:MAG: hypothetical protein Ta2D_01150 [Rickettsiales bacterium]